ncbi:MAG: hypothetical protein AAGF81_19475, partial [Pseudomonadota bacterium]
MRSVKRLFRRKRADHIADEDLRAPSGARPFRLGQRLRRLAKSHRLMGLVGNCIYVGFLGTALLYSLAAGGHFTKQGSAFTELTDDVAGMVGLSAGEITIE